MTEFPSRRTLIRGLASAPLLAAQGPGAARAHPLQHDPEGSGIINVKDFGATGNGTADDHAAILAALELLKRNSPMPARGDAYFAPAGTLYFPPGRYRVSKPIDIRNTVRILGCSTGGQGGEATQLIFPANSDGIVVQRHNTSGATGRSPDATSGEGSVIEGLTLVADTQGVRRGSTACGFRLRARCELVRCTASYFAQDGFFLGASLDANTHPLGSTSHSKLEDCSATHNGRHGFYFGGADGNGIVVINPNMVMNGRFGYVDESFLGITLIGGHSASNGQLDSGLFTDETAIVHHRGFRWFVHVGAEEAASTTEPGTNARVWVQKEPGGPAPNLPDWRRGSRYVSGGSGAIAGGGSSHLGPYCEGGQGHLFIGGSASARGGTVGADGREFYGPGIYQKTNLEGWETFGIVRSIRVKNGRYLRSEIGGEVAGPTDVAFPRTIEDSTIPSGVIRETIYAGTYQFGHASGAFFRATTADSQPQSWTRFGRSRVVPHAFNAPVFALNDHADQGQTRIVAYGSGPPTGGEHAQGEILFNIAPQPGGVFAWSCVASGTPGHWVAVPMPAA